MASYPDNCVVDFLTIFGCQCFGVSLRPVTTIAVICGVIFNRIETCDNVHGHVDGHHDQCDQNDDDVDDTEGQVELDQFMEQLKEEMVTINMIRKYNSSLKLMFGGLLTAAFANSIFCLFILMTTDGYDLIFITVAFFGPIEIILLVSFIFIPSFVAVKFREEVVGMIRRGDRLVRCGLAQRFKVSYILEGMANLDSFDCYDFIPQIQHMFAVWVINEQRQLMNEK